MVFPPIVSYIRDDRNDYKPSTTTYLPTYILRFGTCRLISQCSMLVKVPRNFAVHIHIYVGA
jgi:hypothetical protein